MKRAWPIAILTMVLCVPLALAQQSQRPLTNAATISRGTQAQVPELPPINHNPRRDASPAADTATKAQIKSKLDLQIAALRKNPALSRAMTVRPSVIVPREIAALQRQKNFVETLRRQGVLAAFKAPNGQLGANSRTMAATPPITVPPQTRTPAGSLMTGGGTLLLNSGTNQDSSKLMTGGGTLALNGGASQSNSRTVAPPQTVTTAGAPAMRQAPTSSAQHQTVSNSPASVYANAANAPRVTIAGGSLGGYVVWDTSKVHYQLSTPCQGLQVTVSSTSAGGLQTLASSTNFTTPFGIQPVWNFSGQGSQGPWMVCGYVFHKMPERVPLHVNAVVTQPSAFTSSVSFTARPAAAQKIQLQIPGGTCGNTPDSTLATVLNSGPVFCGDYAFDVNFAGLNGSLNAALTNSKVCFGARIDTVNGVDRVQNAITPVVFTQDPAFNDYIITGCGFGSGEGKQQVYLSGAVTGGRINMTILQWSPTQIEAVVQWGLTGVLDGWPDLNVVPANGGAPAKFPNCRFYAQRQSVLLLGIPKQYAHLANIQVGDSTHGRGTMYCPGGSADWANQTPCIYYNGSGQPLDAICLDCKNWPNQIVTNSVDRDGGQLQFDGGEDDYDLSYLAPGFSVDYFEAYWYWFGAYTCQVWQGEPQKAGDSIDFDPPHGPLNWSIKTKTEIAVQWSPDHCAWRWLGIFRVDDEYNSGYSLQVYVKGPIGVDPWAGHGTSQ